MTTTPKAIRKIQVHKLFGTYDYTLSPSLEACSPERLLILYGDNGSGKTTILKALFHLLAPEEGEGHKTIVARIPFDRLEVEFTTGDHIWAQRPEGKTLSTFTMGLRFAHKKETTVDFIADEENAIKATSGRHDKQIKVFLAKLRDLDISLYLLSDDRTVRFAGRRPREISFERSEALEEGFAFYQDLPPHIARARRLTDLEEQAQQLLIGSMRRAQLWIQSQAVRGAAEGESSVNTLYNEILKKIFELPLQKTSETSEVRKIEEQIQTLESRSRNYSRYGLLPEFNGKDILSIVSNATPSQIDIVSRVLSPYLDSVEKKLDAMERLQRQIDGLVSIVNSFFTRKSLTFEIHNGFDILTEDGKKLAPQMLSSGERHLLLLFCNTLIALDRPSIFMIDEPEISLNIKWQRRLLSSLLECASDNPVQYLLATHSIELLAQQEGNVIKLSETSDVSNERKANA